MPRAAAIVNIIPGCLEVAAAGSGLALSPTLSPSTSNLASLGLRLHLKRFQFHKHFVERIGIKTCVFLYLFVHLHMFNRYSLTVCLLLIMVLKCWDYPG